MQIENEMLSRFSDLNKSEINLNTATLSEELDFFFGNVMDSVVNYFQEEVIV